MSFVVTKYQRVATPLIFSVNPLTFDQARAGIPPDSLPGNIPGDNNGFTPPFASKLPNLFLISSWSNTLVFLLYESLWITYLASMWL